MSTVTEPDARSDAEAVAGTERHAHTHSHPGAPHAHGVVGDGHRHSHTRDGYQHHSPEQHSTTDKRVVAIIDLATKLAAEYPGWSAYGISRAITASLWEWRSAEGQWAGSDGDRGVRQPAGRDAEPDHQAGRDPTVRQPDRQPDAGPAAVPGRGAMRTYTFTEANRGAVGQRLYPVSNTDPLDRPGLHSHPYLFGTGGISTHTHGRPDTNTPGHTHFAYGARIDPGAVHSPAAGTDHVQARAGDSTNRGADAKHATPTIRAIDDTPDTDTSQDRRRREALEQERQRWDRAIEQARVYDEEIRAMQELEPANRKAYPRKDGHEEGA